MPLFSFILSEVFLAMVRTEVCNSLSICAVPMLSNNLDCSITDFLIVFRKVRSWDNVTAEEYTDIYQIGGESSECRNKAKWRISGLGNCRRTGNIEYKHPISSKYQVVSNSSTTPQGSCDRKKCGTKYYSCDNRRH